MTTYEWDLETVDLSTGPLHGDETDIIDHHFFDTCPGLPTEPDQRLVLVRDSDRDYKAWAYVTPEGDLPAWMRDAHGAAIAKVPARHRASFNAATRK